LSTTQTDRIGSVQSSLAMKAPCRAATTADTNAALSGGALGGGGGGLFAIDGVALNAGDRVLAKNQSDPTTNGIYVATTTAWQRDIDFQDNRAVTKGTVVLVTDGIASAGVWFELTSANPVTIGASPLTCAVTSNPAVSPAMAAVIGAATTSAARAAMAVPGLGDALFTAPNAPTARSGIGAEAQSGLLDDIACIAWTQGDLMFYNGTHLPIWPPAPAGKRC
jgi:hypothetical protein